MEGGENRAEGSDSDSEGDCGNGGSDRVVDVGDEGGEEGGDEGGDGGVSGENA